MRKKLSIAMVLFANLFLLNACSDLFSDITKISLRPTYMDLDGVTSFVVVDNTSVTKTKSTSSSSTSQTLYSIDINGNFKITNFQFEVEGQTLNDNVIKEISSSLQIVPSLITDLGKYILFSGCKYQMVNSNISDDAKKYCKQLIEQNPHDPNMVVYMIRKSDGALFNLTENFCFSYALPEYEEKILPFFDEGFYIPTDTYITSAGDNLYILSCMNGFAVYKVEDNGDMVDFKQITQPQSCFGKFRVDADENIYITNWFTNEYGREVYIYGANGRFNMHRFDTQVWLLDMKTDETGIPYLFTFTENNEVQSARLMNCMVEIESKKDLGGSSFNFKDNEYIGCYNDCYNWCDYSSILTYNKRTHEWSIRNISSDILQLLSANNDAVIYGRKAYCANVKNNAIEVTEINFISETYRTYSFDIDMTSIIPTSYHGQMIQDTPYMKIEGRSPINGAPVSYTIDLINGVNISTYAPDGRNIVSFFRIN
jgi:hypothetical protein